MAPWLPKNKPIETVGALTDRANPYRGVDAPVIAGAAVRTRFYEGSPDPRLAVNGGTIVPQNPLDPTPSFRPVFRRGSRAPLRLTIVERSTWRRNGMSFS
jgi:hypothetical protein